MGMCLMRGPPRRQAVAFMTALSWNELPWCWAAARFLWGAVLGGLLMPGAGAISAYIAPARGSAACAIVASPGPDLRGVTLFSCKQDRFRRQQQYQACQHPRPDLAAERLHLFSPSSGAARGQPARSTPGAIKFGRIPHRCGEEQPGSFCGYDPTRLQALRGPWAVLARPRQACSCLVGSSAPADVAGFNSIRAAVWVAPRPDAAYQAAAPASA